MLNIFFLMNGNIFNYSLALGRYEWCGLLRCYNPYAIPPAPPANISTITGEPIFVQSYINAYNTAFNQSVNFQYALNRYYRPILVDNINSNFISGTFGYLERYSSRGNSQSNIIIKELKDELSEYYGQPYLFISTGSGGGSGFMYLNWIIVTYGVPYVVSVS
ncbi:MAG: hypothetical protein NO130_05355 [Sulfolobales archaeon]|nr:hypothetical protein [Sulfolobales archaeon]